MCFICPYYSEAKNKEVKKKRRQAYPFSLRTICSISHEGKGEKEKKKKYSKEWTCKSTPFPYLPISANLELWESTLSDLTGHVSNPRNRSETLFFGALAEWQND